MGKYYDCDACETCGEGSAVRKEPEEPCAIQGGVRITGTPKEIGEKIAAMLSEGRRRA